MPRKAQFHSSELALLRPLNPDAAGEFWDGRTRERYPSSSKPYSLAPMMGERVGVRGRQENGQRPSLLTALNMHQLKLQPVFSFANLE